MRAYLSVAGVLLCLFCLVTGAMAEENLATARRKLADLRARYTERHPDVQSALEKVKKLEAQERARAAQKPTPSPSPGSAKATAPAPANDMGKVVQKIQQTAHELVNKAVTTKVTLPVSEAPKTPTPAKAPEVKSPVETRPILVGPRSPTSARAPEVKSPAAAKPPTPPVVAPVQAGNQPMALQTSSASASTPGILQAGRRGKDQPPKVTRQQREQERALLRKLIREQEGKAGGN